MNHQQFIRNHLLESARTKERVVETCSEAIGLAIGEIIFCLRNHGKILICGNGGSAADAQHIAAEFVVRLSHDLQRPAIPALALTTDTSLLTAAGNDIGFRNIFARQVEAFGQAGDVFIGITTSGNSENVLLAVQKATELGMISIGLLGGDGGKAKDMFSLPIIIPSLSTQHIQESHITIGHIICEAVERELYQNK